MTSPVQIYYDGACPVCSREMALYQSRPTTVPMNYVDVSRVDCGALGADLTRDQALARMHVRMPDGTLRSGAAAFAVLWSVTPGFRWLGHLVALPVVAPIAEWAYRAFLVIRRVWRRAPTGAATRP